MRPMQATGGSELAHEQLARFEENWLQPARLAPLAFDPAPAEVSQGGLHLRVVPLRPEQAEWNQRADGSPRLFNDLAGMFFTVSLTGDADVRWSPAHTTLEVNRPGRPLAPFSSPEEALLPLMQVALLQEREGIDGDLVQRTRRAGAFRAAYLPVNQVTPPLDGVLGFSLPSPEIALSALRLTLAFDTPSGLTEVVVRFE